MSQLKVNVIDVEFLNFMAKNININFGIEIKRVIDINILGKQQIKSIIYVHNHFL